MMKQVYSDIIQFRGTHFDFGYKQGELLRDSFILPNRRKQWKSQYKRHFIVDLPKVKYMFLTFAPTIWRNFEDLLQHFIMIWRLPFVNLVGII